MVSRITDSEFDSNRTKEYKLSIQVSPDGFSFSVVHPVKNRILAFYDEEIKLSSLHFIGRRFDEWLENHQEILKKEFAEINLYYYSGKYTLAPSAFYDYKNQDTLINLLFGSDKACETRDNYIPEVSANLIFTIPLSLIETFQNHYPGIAVQHPLSGFIANTKKENSKNSSVFLFFNRKSFDILLFSEGSLLTVNHFKSVVAADVAYFLFSVLKSNNINAKDTEMELAGNITEESETFRILCQFFKTVRLKNISVDYDFEAFGKAPYIHTFFY